MITETLGSMETHSPSASPASINHSGGFLRGQRQSEETSCGQHLQELISATLVPLNQKYFQLGQEARFWRSLMIRYSQPSQSSFTMTSASGKAALSSLTTS